jgi:UDP-N-acetyl-D-mannosaminuronate dehydrogenase
MISNTKIAIIGLGYVGLPLERFFATKYVVAHVSLLDLDLALLQNDSSLKPYTTYKHILIKF